MKITASMDSTDIQNFFNTYMSQTFPSALCKRVALAVRANLPNGDDEFRQMLLDFANKIEELEYAQRKIEDKLLP